MPNSDVPVNKTKIEAQNKKYLEVSALLNIAAAIVIKNLIG
jgi:hypothetical protein